MLSSPVHEWRCRIHGLSAAVMTKCLNLDSFMHFMKRRRRNYLVTPFLLGTKLLTWIRSDEFNPILSRKIEELPEPSRTRSYDAAVSSKVERLYGATADARGHALTPWHGAPVSASAQVPAPVASREPPRALEEMQRRRFSRRHDRMCVLFKSCLIF